MHLCSGHGTFLGHILAVDRVPDGPGCLAVLAEIWHHYCPPSLLLHNTFFHKSNTCFWTKRAAKESATACDRHATAAKRRRVHTVWQRDGCVYEGELIGPRLLCIATDRLRRDEQLALHGKIVSKELVTAFEFGYAIRKERCALLASPCRAQRIPIMP